MTEVLQPRLRGVFHQYAFVAAVVAGTLLVVLADGYLERFAVWVYAVALAAMFGASALYHRYPWRSASARLRARRLDHAMIFVFIAGTYTAFALVAFAGTARIVGLVTVWVGAALGIVLEPRLDRSARAGSLRSRTSGSAGSGSSSSRSSSPPSAWLPRCW